MRIVIEGPDGVGKSTLAHYLARILCLEYLHRGPPSSREELIHDIHLDDVIFDRSWLGNVVYSGLLIENTQYMHINITIFSCTQIYRRSCANSNNFTFKTCKFWHGVF